MQSSRPIFFKKLQILKFSQRFVLLKTLANEARTLDLISHMQMGAY